MSDARRIDKDRDIVTRLILEAELRRTARRYVGTQPAPGEPSLRTELRRALDRYEAELRDQYERALARARGGTVGTSQKTPLTT